MSNNLISRDDVERVKPAPDLFLKTLEVLEIGSDVVEDSLKGLIATQKPKLKIIIASNPVTEALPFEKYHLKLRTMKEMSLFRSY